MPVVIAALTVALALCTLGRPRLLGATPRTGADPTQQSSTHRFSVIVPARNEAASLPTLLTSLAANTVRPAEVIVVDDHSSDATATVAAAAGAIVIDAPSLPDGWTGKSWACHHGAAHATQPVVVFLDADTELAPDALGRVVELVERVDLVSVQPWHRTGTAVESLSAIFNTVALMGSGSFALIPRSRVAFGPCLATTMAAYRRVGGHDAVRGDVVEDIALAERYRADGLTVGCWMGGGLLSFRMYPDGLRAIVQGWTKNIAAGAQRASGIATMLAVIWVIGLAAVAGAVIGGVASWINGGDAPIAALIAWALTSAHLWVLWRRVGSFGWAVALLYVVPLAFFLAVFARSAFALGRGSTVSWRGRAVHARSRSGP